MNTSEFVREIKKRYRVVLISLGSFLLIAAVITLVQPLKYRADSRLLVMQKNSNSDFYTLSKSNQYLSSLISETVSSGSFFDSLTASSTNVNWNYFSGTYKQKMKTWKETIEAQSPGDNGIISLSIYHPNAEQARAISVAVDNQILNQGYSGVSISIIDQPIVTAIPVRPNIFINFSLGLVFGLAFAMFFILYFPKKEPVNGIDIKIRHIAGDSKAFQNRNIAIDSNPRINGDIRNIM